MGTGSYWTIAPFFIAVSEVEPIISHAEAHVDVLEDSNPEKKCFRALVGLARATTLLYQRNEAPDGFTHDIREGLIQLLHAYRYVLPSSFSSQVSRGDMTQVWRTGYFHCSH